MLALGSPQDPTELASYRVLGPADTPVGEMVRGAGRRWTIAEGFEQAKGEVGLDQDEVRRYDAWYRHVTRVAQAYLEVTRLSALTAAGGAQDQLAAGEAPGGDRLPTEQR